MIRYQLPEAQHVSLILYNILGEEALHVVDEMEGAGYKEVSINAGNLAGGVYTYRLIAGRFNDVRKLLLLK